MLHNLKKVNFFGKIISSHKLEDNMLLLRYTQFSHHRTIVEAQSRTAEPGLAPRLQLVVTCNTIS